MNEHPGLASLRGTNVLIVGGAGFVGSNLCRAVLTLDPRQVVVVDNLLSSEVSAVPDDEKVTFLEGSITDDRILSRLPEDLDVAFHLATYHGNQSSIEDPLADHEHNLLTSLRLFHRLKDVRTLRAVVYASAGCTVARKTFEEAEATSEDDPVSLHLDSPYQISKIVGEMYGNFYHHHHGLPLVKARFQNVYGPWEVLGAGRWRGTPATVWRNVVPTFVYRALRRLPLPLENEGRASRDFIYVDDIVDGLLACAVNGRPGEVYNLASGVETTIADLAALVNELTGNPTPPEVRPARSWDRSGKRFGSTDKAATELGFKAGTDLRAGLTQTVEWTRAHLDVIEAAMRRHARYVPEVRELAGP